MGIFPRASIRIGFSGVAPKIWYFFVTFYIENQNMSNETLCKWQSFESQRAPTFSSPIGVNSRKMTLN